jgi:serine/threonine-protein kinase RsbW
MAHVELQLPPDNAFVGLARLVVVAAARNAGMDETRREDLRIAVSEATTNAVAAHRRTGVESPVVLRFGAVDSEFQVTIADAGGGFEPPDGGLDGRDWTVEGGLGITVIRGLADDVEFVRGSGTRVHLKFSLSLNDHGKAPAPVSGTDSGQ